MDRLGDRLRGWLVQLPDHIQVEDVSLVAVLLLSPFLTPLTSTLPFFGSDNDVVGGLVAFLAALGAMLAMATRVPDENRFEQPATDSAAFPTRTWLVGPLIGAVGFVAGDSLDRMGLPGGDVLILIAFIVSMVAFVGGRHLPVVSRTTRRLLVGPFVLLAGAFLQHTAAGFISIFAGTDVLGQVVALHNVILEVELFVLLGIAAGLFYEMLVFAPRELADPGASARTWEIRFAIFYVSLVVAILIGSSAPLLVT